MLTRHPKPVSLSLMATDLPVWSVLETSATLYQQAPEQFHLLLTEPVVQCPATPEPPSILQAAATPRLLWLEISPYRLIMTMQGNGGFSYRHWWEQGVYGISRYWLQDSAPTVADHLRLRNFTRSLSLTGRSLPERLRLEYELWTANLQLGQYVLHLEIQH
ncbi:hypothetical protein DO97_21320 [Neosynechococcus sphagnicola sy1]|uniref:Uncharacterized protein n=2 Tax=Neosynechococcus TaxID=1501143 RepID=A0A098TRB5_9CYAN|nr:hypothetical protein DO97_21320 [Neosynechococcus sphagnicola sy1]